MDDKSKYTMEATDSEGKELEFQVSHLIKIQQRAAFQLLRTNAEDRKSHKTSSISRAGARLGDVKSA